MLPGRKPLVLYDQTALSDRQAGTQGDCFRACIRTLFQEDMPDLPTPLTSEGTWNAAFDTMLRDRYGYRYRLIRTPGGFEVPSWIPDGEGGDELVALPRVIIAAGRTVRSLEEGPIHAVVWDREAQRVVHDPHPSRAGLIDIHHVTYPVPCPIKMSD